MNLSGEGEAESPTEQLLRATNREKKGYEEIKIPKIEDIPVAETVVPVKIRQYVTIPQSKVAAAGQKQTITAPEINPAPAMDKPLIEMTDSELRARLKMLTDKKNLLDEEYYAAGLTDERTFALMREDTLIYSEQAEIIRAINKLKESSLSDMVERTRSAGVEADRITYSEWVPPLLRRGSSAGAPKPVALTEIKPAPTVTPKGGGKLKEKATKEKVETPISKPVDTPTKKTTTTQKQVGGSYEAKLAVLKKEVSPLLVRRQEMEAEIKEMAAKIRKIDVSGGTQAEIKSVKLEHKRINKEYEDVLGKIAAIKQRAVMLQSSQSKGK